MTEVCAAAPLDPMIYVAIAAFAISMWISGFIVARFLAS